MENIALIINQIVEYMGSFGVIVGFLAVLIESFIPPIPLGVIVGINMLSFGNIIGFVVSYSATIVGCMLSFYLFRYLFKDKLFRFFKKKNRDKINKWMDKLSNIDFNTLVVIIALPVTPSFLLNIAAGLSNISTRKYLIALLVGKPAMLLFYGYIAISFVDSLKDPINFIKIGVLVVGAYIISKIIEKIVKVEN